MNKRTALEAVGATLVLLPFYLPAVGTDNLALYHQGLPVAHLIGGLLVDMLGVAVLVFGFLVAARFLPALVQRVVLALFASLLVARMAIILLQQLSSEVQLLGGERVQSTWRPVDAMSERIHSPVTVAIMLLAGIAAYFLPHMTGRAVRAVRLLTAAVAFSALWIVPELVYLTLIPKQDDKLATSVPSVQGHQRPNRRIIWILFDELSYDQTFDHIAPRVELPNLQRLRAESVSFSALRPAGFYTERIIPSLLLNKHINRIRSTAEGDLWYQDQSENGWRKFDAHASLFGLARDNGWNSGVDGWYNPYCHLLGSELSSCVWEPGDEALVPTERDGASEANSVLANAAVLPGMILAKLTNRATSAANIHLVTFRALMAHAPALIHNDGIQFVFLHLPAPHPPGIYDRTRHSLRSGGSYLDNLVLTDDSLGTLLQEIDATPSANETTLIVSSDHSWRIPIWRHDSGWTEEEEHASGGRFDDRPVLLIHFPGQTTGKDVRVAVPELLEHDMIAGMLTGTIETPQDLAELVAKQGQ